MDALRHDRRHTLATAIRAAEEIVETQWSNVVRLAQALFEREEMTHAEVLRVAVPR